MLDVATCAQLLMQMSQAGAVALNTSPHSATLLPIAEALVVPCIHGQLLTYMQSAAARLQPCAVADVEYMDHEGGGHEWTLLDS